MRFDDLTLTPFKKEFDGYSLRDLHGDLTAGISVALLTMPQAMAYALIAGLPLSTGLFAAIFSALIAAIFGSTRHLVVGPSNAIAILIQYGASEILYTYYRHLTGIERDIVALQIVTQLSLIVGILLLLAASFRLGRLTQFVSQSVIVGYIAGCSIAIITNQLFVFLGYPEIHGLSSLFNKGIYIVTHLGQIHWVTAAVGGGCLLMIVLLKRWNKRFPAAALTFLVATGIVYGFRIVFPEAMANVTLVGDTGDVGNLVPYFRVPYFETSIINGIVPISFAVALLSVLETSSVAKSVSASTGNRASINQEIFALGLGNMMSAFLGAMPVSGSTSRTTLNLESGAQTRLSAIFAALFVGFILYAFSPLVQQIPLASLAALLLVTAKNIVKKEQLLLCLKSTSSDAYVFWITFLSCVFFSIDIAFYIGVCISITLYLKKAAVPHVLQYTVDDAGRFKNLDFCTPEEIGKIRLIKVKGELFFGAADLFQATLKSICEDKYDTRVIILQLKNARDIDATACLAIRQLYEFLKSSGRHLILSGLTLSVWEVLSASGIVSLMGKENLFIIDERHPQEYMDRVIIRAQALAHQSIQTESECDEVFSPQSSQRTQREKLLNV